MHKRAEEEREWEEDDDQVVMAVGMLHQSSQHQSGSQPGRGPNINRHRHSRTFLRMLAFGASADQVDEIARMRKSTILESLVRFCDVIETLYTRDYLRKPTPRDLQRLL
ncbi:unnamed protein product [Prunus brigantina]